MISREPRNGKGKRQVFEKQNEAQILDSDDRLQRLEAYFQQKQLKDQEKVEENKRLKNLN